MTSRANVHIPKISRLTTLASNRAAYGIVIAFSGALILLTVIEIILACTHKLKPAFFLSSACFKAVICLVYFILNVVGAASVGGASIAGIILSLAATIATILQVIYGSIIVHRTRKGFYNYGAVAHKDGNEVEMGAGHHQHTGVTYQ